MKYTLVFLIILTFPKLAFSQEIIERYRFNFNGFCNSNVWLLDDGTFVTENGCESSSSVSYGTWKKHGDTISFTTLDINNFNPIDTMFINGNNTDSIRVKVVDKNAYEITQKIKPLLHIKNKARYPFDNPKGEKTSRMVGAMICLSTIENLFNKPCDIDPALGSNFTIVLSIPELLLMNGNSTWGGQTIETFVKRGDTYEEVSLPPSFFSTDPVEQIYKPIK